MTAIKGWVLRVKRGVYIPVPLEAKTAEIALEDPWVIAEKIYSPCYIGGWSAVEYWGFTEQIFRTIKDYALGWILAGIGNNTELSDKLIFI